MTTKRVFLAADTKVLCKMQEIREEVIVILVKKHLCHLQ